MPTNNVNSPANLLQCRLAEHHVSNDADLDVAIKAFDHTYAINAVEAYFGFYAYDATVFFYGARQDVSAYHTEWIALMPGGGGAWKIVSLHFSEIPKAE